MCVRIYLRKSARDVDNPTAEDTCMCITRGLYYLHVFLYAYVCLYRGIDLVRTIPYRKSGVQMALLTARLSNNRTLVQI